MQLTVALVRKADGSPSYFISVVQDLSALKATEDALRTSERLMQQAQTLAGFASWEADMNTWRFRSVGGSHLRLGLPSAEFSPAVNCWPWSTRTTRSACGPNGWLPCRA